MSKKFTKRKAPVASTDPAALAEQKALQRLRKQAAARLLKRRRRKSGQ